MTTILLVTAFLFWVVLNLAAPHAAVLTAVPISIGRLPVDLLTGVDHQKVRFYTAELSGGYGYSLWAPPFKHVVVFDKVFFARAPAPLIRYVVAHELAHFHLGHHKKRWWCIVTCAALLPPVKKWLRGMEEEADAIAEQRTGLSRTLFPELR